jgi:antitoxin ParD1/3/4
MNVSLTEELKQFVERKVASGMYHTASEVIREGLRLLAEQDEAREQRITEVRAKVKEGLDQLDRGEGRSGGDAFGRLEARIAKLERDRNKR